MPIEFVTGDLFVNRVRAEAFAHGCNCAGSMGAGIAVGFKERYPAMFEEFRRQCKTKPPEFTLGGGGLLVQASGQVIQLPPHVLVGQGEELAHRPRADLAHGLEQPLDHGP